MKMRATKPCLVLLILVIINVVSMSESATTLFDTMKTLEDVNSDWKEGICGTACIAASAFQIDFDDCLGRCSSALPGLMKKNTLREANWDWKDIACAAACKAIPYAGAITECSFVCRKAVHELILKKSTLQKANELHGLMMKKTLEEANWDWKDVLCYPACSRSNIPERCMVTCRRDLPGLMKKTLQEAMLGWKNAGGI